MPTLTTTLSQSSPSDEPTKVLIAELHLELIKLGNLIDEGTERSPRKYGATTARAVSALQQQY